MLDSSGILAAALVDARGNSAAIAKFADVAAFAAVRYGVQFGAVPAVLAARPLAGDPSMEFPEPDGVMAVAVCRPGELTVLAHVGDALAFGWTDGKLEKLTEPHTKGQRMRCHGEPEDVSAKRDHIIINSIGRATVTTTTLTETRAQTVVLMSDGAYRKLSDELIADILRVHAAEPVVCAEKFVDAAYEAGTRDDATAVVIRYPTPLDRNAPWGR